MDAPGVQDRSKKKQRRITSYMPDAKPRPSLGNFKSDIHGRCCGGPVNIADVHDTLASLYAQAGWRHKEYPCCPSCAAEDVRSKVPGCRTDYSRHELFCYTEATGLACFHRTLALWERTYTETRELREEIARLQQEIDHFHHLDDMRARDKANKRKREN
jgi:hypothetical protein